MTKLKLHSLVLILFIVLVVGCLQQEVSKCGKVKGEVTSILSEKEWCYISYGFEQGEEQCENQEKELCSIGSKLKNRNIGDCSEEKCFLSFGILFGDEECTNTSDQNRRFCSIGNAIREKDPKICDGLIFNRTVVFERRKSGGAEFASGNDDERVEYNITETWMREVCYHQFALFYKDPEICAYLNSSQCFHDVAIASDNPEVCDRAGSLTLDCRKKIFFERAEFSRDVTDCYKVQDFDYDVADCATRVAIANKDIRVCQGLLEGYGRVREDCFAQVAPLITELNDCDLLDDPIQRKDCYQRLSPSAINLCNTGSKSGDLDCKLNAICKERGIYQNCYEYISNQTSEITWAAVQLNSANLCEPLDLKEFCYFGFARNLELSLNEVIEYNLSGQGEAMCNKARGNARKKCFFNLAIESMDEKHCEESLEFAEKCRQNIEIKRIGMPREGLMSHLKSKIQDKGIERAGLQGSNGYPGQAGILQVRNSGLELLQGRNFRLYKNFRLADMDGCDNNKLIIPKESDSIDYEGPFKYCQLEFYSEATGVFKDNSKGDILEITYNDETIFVTTDYGMPLW